MSVPALPQPFDCSETCVPSGTSTQPGPTGPAGADGTNGTNGIDAFSFSTTGTDAMPAEAATVIITVTPTSDWMTVGQIVYVQFWGYMEVVSKPTDVTVELLNLEDTATGAYASNAAPTTLLPPSAEISPAGLQGPTGTTDTALFLQVANNLSDVNNVATSRNNLGLGTAALFTVGVANGEIPNIQDAGGIVAGDFVVGTGIAVEGLGAAAARTALGLGTSATIDIGTADTEIPPVDDAAGLTAGEVVVATANGLESVDAATLRALIGLAGGYGLLGTLENVDLDDATDNAITIIGATRYRIDKMTFCSPSAAVTTATAGMFTAPAAGGTTLASIQALSTGLTGTTKFMDLTPQAVVGTTVRTEATLYLNISTPEGSARSADFRLYGWIFE